MGPGSQRVNGERWNSKSISNAAWPFYAGESW